MAAAVQQPLYRPPLVSPVLGFNSAHTKMSNGIPEPSSVTSKSQSYDGSPEQSQSGATTNKATASQSSLKKKKSNKPKVSLEVRRSSSTPHMHTGSSGEADPLSPKADKRRNKLGYHRTSVACVHCRRRKIRCLVAQDESQGPRQRCLNCIRLKKECNFYPVEQDTQNQQSQSAKSEVSSSLPSASNPSSPQNLPPTLETSEEYHHYNSLPTPLSAGFRVGPEPHNNPEHPRSACLPYQAIPPQTFPYPDGDRQWAPQAFPGSFVPAGSHSQPPTEMPLAYSHQDPQDWSASQRSMSVGGNPHHTFPQQRIGPPGYGDRSTHFYPPPLNTHLPGSIPANMSGPMTAPVTIAPFSQSQWSYNGTHMAQQSAHMHEQAYSGNWCSDPIENSLHKSEEEVVPATSHYSGNSHFSPFPR